MTFNSIEFGVFFFIVIALCAVLPRARVAILLVGSFVFYSWISWKFGLILFGMSAIAYATPTLLAKAETRATRVAILFACVGAILAPLLLLKYFNFFASIKEAAIPSIHFRDIGIPILALAALTCLVLVFSVRTQLKRFRGAILLVGVLAVAAIAIWRSFIDAGVYAVLFVMLNKPLPPGISFHSFQVIAYVIDVYKKRAVAETRPGIFFLFSSFFPQLVAGPIERPNHLIPQLADAGRLTRANSGVAIQFFLHGLFLKVAIADVIGIEVDQIYSASASHGGAALLAGTILFYIQIYCDFAGYSLMALGVARALGVTLVQNFHAPVLATSPTDFWHRWHISLSQWFRDYVYVPLGGRKQGILGWVFAISITFILSGLWHGANWTYVLWGAVHGAGLVLSVLAMRAMPKHIAGAVAVGVAWLATQVFVTLTWVLFRASSVSQATDILFTIGRDFLVTGEAWAEILALPQKLGWPPSLIVLGLVVLTWVTLLDRATFNSPDGHAFNHAGWWARRAQQAAMVIGIAVALTFGPATSRPFIYFQF